MTERAYIEELHRLQEKEGLVLANKLRRGHVQWEKYKMCTRKALQTLSNSVADSIDYCREKLKLTQFQGSAPLTKFFRTLIFFFDILNSKSKFGKHWLPFLRTKSMSIEIFSEKQKSIFLS